MWKLIKEEVDKRIQLGKEECHSTMIIDEMENLIYDDDAYSMFEVIGWDDELGGIKWTTPLEKSIKRSSDAWWNLMDARNSFVDKIKKFVETNKIIQRDMTGMVAVNVDTSKQDDDEYDDDMFQEDGKSTKNRDVYVFKFYLPQAKDGSSPRLTRRMQELADDFMENTDKDMVDERLEEDDFVMPSTNRKDWVLIDETWDGDGDPCDCPELPEMDKPEEPDDEEDRRLRKKWRELGKQRYSSDYNSFA